MKKNISPLALLILLIPAFTACNLSEKQAPDMNNLDLAVEEVFAEDIMEDVLMESYDILFDVSDYGILKSEDTLEIPDCPVRTVERPEDGKWPKTVTLDFGEGCEDKMGNIRKGKIIITVNGLLREEGSSRTMTFEDYYVNDNKIEGVKTITNAGREDGFIVFNVELSDGRIIRADGIVIERSALKTRTWIEGEDTRMARDDVFVINGTVNKVNKDGVNIVKTITDLVRARDCRWPLSGTVEITTDDDRPVAVIDYGEGECDRFATVTIGEGDDAETWIVDLRKRGIKWTKQDDGQDGVEKEETEG
jgi:hypothetical protein